MCVYPALHLAPWYDPIIPPLSHTQPQKSTLASEGQSLNWIEPSQLMYQQATSPEHESDNNLRIL